MTLSWRQVGIYAGLASLSFLAGVGVTLAIAGGDLPGEIIGLLVALVVTVISGALTVGRVVIERIVAALQPGLEANTNLTRETHQLVNGERILLRQELQAERLGRETAERALHLIEIHPACSGCRSAVTEVLDKWRTWRREGSAS